MAAEPIRKQNRTVRHQEKWGPKDGRPDCKQIANVAGTRVLIGAGLIVRIQPRFHESKIAMAPILFKPEIVLDEWGPQVGIVSYSVTMYEWIN